MDVIAMHQAGFTNTVAALGTSFPDEQIQLIARYADRINLIFDADGAGQKATRRAIENLRKTGLDVHVVTIPDGKDPDEFLKRNGAEAFKRLLGQSANAVEYRLLEIGKTNDIRTTDGRVAYLRAAVPITGTPSRADKSSRSIRICLRRASSMRLTQTRTRGAASSV